MKYLLVALFLTGCTTAPSFMEPQLSGGLVEALPFLDDQANEGELVTNPDSYCYTQKLMPAEDCLKVLVN